ncbi:MAG: primosomal protein N', partial [Bacteroidales bacterium]|nr:primosomal protein N' [Bacteroidales bacterium]
LGSATPSLESLYNCMRGKYAETRLTERYYGADAANVEIIDTSAERRKRGMKGSFSVKLIGLIRKCLDGGGQVMLLRTRRGYAPVLQCSQCGQILRCPHCNIPLTLHKDERKVRCHHCGYVADVALNCTECGGMMAALGAGTQKIEEETAALFPTARIARLDSDVAQDIRAEKDIVGKFAKGEIDILIGTQMVAKGFDFENLALVAVLQTDTLLGVRDFRADEKALQTLVQFRGRCGRRDKNGLIVIQTAQPNHPVYASLLAETTGPETRKTQNWDTPTDKTDKPNEGFSSKSTAETDGNIIKTLLDERKEFGYPPFTRLINIYLRHSNEARVEALAQSLAYELADFKPEGPALPPIDKEAGQHVRVLRLTLPRDKSLVPAKRLILKKIRLFESTQSCPSAITVDVDPS